MELRGQMTGKLLHVILFLACSISLGVAASAGEQELSKILQERQDAEQKWEDAYHKAKTDEERSALKYPSADEYAARVLAVAKKYPDDPAALDALVWIAQNCRKGDELDAALPMILATHANQSKVGDAVSRLLFAQSKEVEPFLRAIAEKSSNDNVKGKALLTLGRLLKEQAPEAAFLRTNADAKRLENVRKWRGEEVMKKLQASDPADLQKEAEQTLETVIAKYGKQKGASRTLGEPAKGELFEMKHLQIGMVAPEIKGADVDGKKFALSDYRGKVVVLDFWGHW